MIHLNLIISNENRKSAKNGRRGVQYMLVGRCVLTSLFDMGVLSSSGRCCSKARTMQLAIMVARIMYSNGVEEEG